MTPTHCTAPRTAREAAELLAAQGKHSHLHAEHETICISGHCTPTPTVIGTRQPLTYL